MLNNFFASAYTSENCSDNLEVKNISTIDPINVMQDVIINDELVLKELNNLKKHKSGGPDSLNSNLLIELKQAIVEPLVYIFRDSLSTSVVPKDWKEASIKPLFKKGSRKSVENYRPISLTSQVGKILERIIKGQVNGYGTWKQII